MKLSIIISNYNYQEFLGAAIDSALAVDWPDKEVIVVDDGSTDGSRDIIVSYGTRIIPLFKANGGQNSAANLGFQQSVGDVILFLDSDDVLLPECGSVVMDRDFHAISAAQFPLRHVDKSGRQLGRQWPIYTTRHTPEYNRQTLIKTGFYDAPTTSGIAWSRDFLDEVFPLPTIASHGRKLGRFFDAYLVMLAPFFGDVVSIGKPLGHYRVHDANGSTYGRFDLQTISERCAIDLARVEAVNDILCGRGLLQKPLSVHMNREFMRYRLMERKLVPGRNGSSLASVLLQYYQAVWLGDRSWVRRLCRWIWGTLLALGPRALAAWLVRVSSEPGQRPALLQGIWMFKMRPVPAWDSQEN